jgi:hypothetical protein
VEYGERENEIDHGGDVLGRGFGAHDRRMRVWALCHFGRTRGVAAAAQVEQINVVTARGDVIHPGTALDRQIEGGMRRISSAVHE